MSNDDKGQAAFALIMAASLVPLAHARYLPADLRAEIREAQDALMQEGGVVDLDAPGVLDHLHAAVSALFRAAVIDTPAKRDLREAFEHAMVAYRAVAPRVVVAPWTMMPDVQRAARHAVVLAFFEDEAGKCARRLSFGLPPDSFKPDDSGVSRQAAMVMDAVVLAVPPSRLDTAEVYVAYLDAGFGEVARAGMTDDEWLDVMRHHTLASHRLNVKEGAA